MGIAIQWPLVLFTLVAGTGGALLVPMGIAEIAKTSSKDVQFKACVASLAMLAVGGCFSLLHLASPGNVMAAVTNIGSFSGISMELILLGCTFIAALVFAVALKRTESSAALKAIGAVCIVFALLFMFFSGHGYVMEARPAWNTQLLPLAYVGTVLACGAFLYALLEAMGASGKELPKVTKYVIVGACVACAFSCAAYAVFLGPELGARSALMYWGGLAVCGVVLSLVMGTMCFLKLEESNAVMLLSVGLAVAVVAALALRVIMWQTGDGFLDLIAWAATGTVFIP